MALQQLSKSQLVKRVQRTQIQHRKQREKTAALLERGAHAGTLAGGAFLAGYLDSRFGGAEGLSIGPVPATLVGGLGAIAIGATGMAGKASDYLISLGAGAAAAALANEGRVLGLAA